MAKTKAKIWPLKNKAIHNSSKYCKKNFLAQSSPFLYFPDISLFSWLGVFGIDLAIHNQSVACLRCMKNAFLPLSVFTFFSQIQKKRKEVFPWIFPNEFPSRLLQTQMRRKILSHESHNHHLAGSTEETAKLTESETIFFPTGYF